ncbi:hypothetical protein JG688_00005466 [Phytophthora aleatoria]|uniref:Ubiquitin-like protease family profile domain-containing protein n=1 Tax=Phytophthora aleatoria TaxID=2496075 RepID=A0A8J5IMG2_9STRA|nr:hypothetical protein JG688_00005466 [Phytophthora aleatoria]
MLCFVLQQWRNVRQNQKVDGAERQPKRICGMNAESKPESDDDDGESKDDVTTGVVTATLKVRINPKARKVGRPQKQKKTTAASERADRKWYKAVEAGRAAAGTDTLDALLAFLDCERPGLVETQRRLSGVLINNKSQNPVLIDDEADIASTPSGVIEVIQIKNVGSFARQQIEVMRRVEILKNTVQSGLEAHKWIYEEGLPVLPAEYHGLAKQVGDQVINTYPYTHIEGLNEAPDYAYSMLYRAIPPAWLSDASIRGLCDRLMTNYPSCRLAGFQSVDPKSSRVRNQGVESVTSELLVRILTQTAEVGVQTVLLPLNLHNTHWCCIVVKVSGKRINYYDPLNQNRT